MAVEIADTRILGHLIRRTRKTAGLTQRGLARAAGVGERFVVELEHGKATSEIGKVLAVLRVLNLGLAAEPPAAVPLDELERDLPPAELRELIARRRP